MWVVTPHLFNIISVGRSHHRHRAFSVQLDVAVRGWLRLWALFQYQVGQETKKKNQVSDREGKEIAARHPK
jgi:hypothetical protein